MIVAGAILALRLTNSCTLIPTYTSTLLYVGLLSATYSALLATTQNDLKRIIALSTSSHIGLMLAGLGVLQPLTTQAHLLQHALCKASLFMTAGTLIHYSHTQDLRILRSYSSIRTPHTTLLLATSSLSLAGTPGLACSDSKDNILLATASNLHSYESHLQHNLLHYILLGLIVLLGAYYTSSLSLTTHTSQHTLLRTTLHKPHNTPD